MSTIYRSTYYRNITLIAYNSKLIIQFISPLSGTSYYAVAQLGGLVGCVDLKCEATQFDGEQQALDWAGKHFANFEVDPEATAALNVCQKCGKQTTKPLIEVDKDDFDVRFWNGSAWVKSQHKVVVRSVCSGCCRG